MNLSSPSLHFHPNNLRSSSMTALPMRLREANSPAQRSHSNQKVDLGFDPGPSKHGSFWRAHCVSGSGLGGPLTTPPVHSLLSLHPVGWLSLVASEHPSSLPASPLWGLACLRRAPPRRGGHAILRAQQGSSVCRLQPPGALGKVDFPRRPRAWCSRQKPTFQAHRLPSLASLTWPLTSHSL